MRPQSIIMFERLFLASLAVSVLSFILTYEQMLAEVDRELALGQPGVGGGILIAIMVVGLAISVLLWHLIARKASSIAKWILVVIVALGVIMGVPSVAAGPWDLSLLLGLAVYVLEVAAVVYLFRADAKAWFAGQWQGDATVFD